MCCHFKNAIKFPIIIILLAGLLFGALTFVNRRSSKNEISYDEALSRIQSREIKAVDIKSNKAKLVFHSGVEFSVSGLTEEQEEGIMNAVADFNVKNYKNSIDFSFAPKTSNPMDRIFQLIFILFFISPPLIVLLLFLIWREMKERNRTK